MKTLQILGPGCARCDQLAEDACAAAEALGILYTLEKVTDIKRFADFGVMTTPALVVDGVVRLVGKVPSVEELKKLIR